MPTPLRIQLTKEMRALLLPWLACVAASVALLAMDLDISLTMLGVGGLTLCAMSMGHEYSLGTLPMLLAQPVSRRRLMFVKLIVLVPMLLALAGAWILAVRGLADLRAFYDVTLLRVPVSALRMVDSGGFFVLAAIVVVAGLSLTPWLTMLSRNALAGVIFTCAIPTLALLAMGFLGTRVPPLIRAPIGVFTEAFFRGSGLPPGSQWCLLALCVMGLVMGWRTFGRLEAIGGPDPDVQVPGLKRSRFATSTQAATSIRQSPVWLLLKKELHLQQLTFVASACFLIIWSAVLAARWLAPTYLGPSLAAMAQIYGGVIALLAGSLSSAEERQIGTVEWQMLLPIPARKQWAVKIGTVVGVTVLLSVLLPAVLALFDSDPTVRDPHALAAMAALAIGMVCLAIAGSYVSTLCTNGLRAFVITLLFVAGAVLAVSIVGQLAGGGVLWLLLHTVRDVGQLSFGPGMIRWVSVTHQAAQVLVLLSAWPLLLRASFVNYQSLDRSPKLISGQVVRVVACVALLATVQSGLSQFIYVGLRHQMEQVRQSQK